MRRLVSLLVLVLASQAAAQDPASPDAGRSAADESRRARVYARIGDSSITVGDIEDAVASQTPFQQQRYASDPAALRALARRLVDLRLMAAEARRRELDRTPRVREVTEGNLVQLLVRQAIDLRITPRSIPDADVDAYYQSHLEEYARPAMARASHVLLATEAEATALLAECRTADVARFRQLARDRSLDTETQQSGGDLRYFTRDGRPMGDVGRPVDAALVQAAFAIREVGECAAAPVRVGDRFSVVKLTGLRQADQTPIEAAREGIRRSLWRQRRDQELERMVSEIKSRVRVTRRDELVTLVELPPPDPEELGQHRHGDQPEPHAPAAGARPAN